LTLRVRVHLTLASRVKIQFVGRVSGSLVFVVRGGAENMGLLGVLLLLGIAANHWRLRVIMAEMTGCHRRAARSVAWGSFPPRWVDEGRRGICQDMAWGTALSFVLR
jgi:hypothetical protein